MSQTYSGVTNQIKVSVQPRYLSEQSDLDGGVYAFAYRVHIENEGPAPVQLLRRHWVVFSGGEVYTEVEGDGVVGEQPVLRSGESFTYTSWSVIKDPVGAMKGEYVFVAESGEMFEAEIPEFDLLCPSMLH